MRIVLDTNVFVSSFLSPMGNPRKIVDVWRSGKLTLCISRSIVEEYLKVLNRLNIKSESINNLLNVFAKGSNVLFIANTSILKIVDSDPDDNKFIECAIALNAEYIISGDHHLLDVKNYLNVKIVSPSTFLKII